MKTTAATGLLGLLVLAAACGGATAPTTGGDAGAPPSTAGSPDKGARSSGGDTASHGGGSGAGPDARAGAPYDGGHDAALGAATCADVGCTTGFTCAHCPLDLVCDDVHGPAACVTVEKLVGCGDGTEFCNSSCGVCIAPGARCVIDTCDATVRTCGSGPKCGQGTRCDRGVCVLD